MEMSKGHSLSVARSILNHKVIGKKLESYLKASLYTQTHPSCTEMFMHIAFRIVGLLCKMSFTQLMGGGFSS